MRVSNLVMTMEAVVVIAAATLPAGAGQLLGSDVWPHTIIDIDRDRNTTRGSVPRQR